MTAGLANEVTKMEITPSSRPARDPNYLNWSVDDVCSWVEEEYSDKEVTKCFRSTYFKLINNLIKI